MPQVLVISAGAFSLIFAWRWMQREADRVEAALKRAERRMRKPASVEATPLEFDASTGLYRPAE